MVNAFHFCWWDATLVINLSRQAVLLCWDCTAHAALHQMKAAPGLGVLDILIHNCCSYPAVPGEGNPWLPALVAVLQEQWPWLWPWLLRLWMADSWPWILPALGTASKHHFFVFLVATFFPQWELIRQRTWALYQAGREMMSGTWSWSSNCFSLFLGGSAGTQRNPLVLWCREICVLE